VQVPGAASGEAATWHVWQAGPTFVDGGEMSWHVLQLPGNVDEVTE
jgi:hypothetical protein